MTTELSDIAGWSAYVSGAAAVLALVAIGLFFVGIRPFGPVNDMLLVLMAISMAPVALRLFQMQPGRWGVLAAAGLLMGLASMTVFAVNNTLMVLGVVKITTYARVADRTLALGMIGFAGIGLWLLAGGLVALLGGQLPAGAAWLGMAAGAGLTIMALGYWRGGMSSPLVIASGLVWQIGYPIWAVWIGRVLLR